MGTVVKEYVGELKGEVWYGFYRWQSKELTRLVQIVSINVRFLVRFQAEGDKDMTSNQLTVVTVDRIPVIEYAKDTTIYAILDETIDLDKRYYNGFYRMVLIKSRTRKTWSQIWMRRIWRM